MHIINRPTARDGICRELARLGLVLGIVGLLIGCAAPQTPLPTITPATPTPERVGTVAPTPIPSPTPLPPDAPQTLTLWVLDLVALPENVERWRSLEQQIEAFEATHPHISVDVLLKKRDGKGGAVDLLTTASAVAPAVVPDLLILDTQALVGVTRAGLIVPLDDLVSPELIDDLYPFAIAACTVDGQLMGVQFQADIQHAVYNTSKIAVPPLTWNDIFASGATYIFPMAGQDGLANEAFLLQYLSTGALLLGEDDNPALDPAALADVLTFYQQGIASGTILTDALSYQKIEDCWPKYLQAGVVISNLSSNLYLSGR
ncbi:MAG: carbohydrate ABC transporter substrate-binding protein, partial [Anaerolineae bacterium]|nr:carbohydrate ABC transporter substrate-binding protein [Anaerolineae bacterium]